ncbi:fatty acid-binding protein isoform X2 [Parasteatoda tepidariorum]|uniref:fatty acid-binding protein isoform X2 n=1 Tax=Parasteatoda tepidariorum TaxID=114398 RepID=UPI000A2C024F
MFENLCQTSVNFCLDLEDRKLAESAPTLVEIKVEGDEYSINTIFYKNKEIKFKLGQEFEEKRFNGDTAKTVVTREGNKLIQIKHGDKIVKKVSEFSGDTMTVTCEVGSVVSTRVFKRQ